MPQQPPNQRGQYGPLGPALSPQLPRVQPPPSPAQPQNLVNHILIGAGLVVGLVAWPMFKSKRPLGVIGLGTSSSMISSGIIGLLMGRIATP